MRKGLEDRLAGIATLAAGALSLVQASALYRYHTGLLEGDHVFPALVGFGLLLAGMILAIRPGARNAEMEKAAVSSLSEETKAEPINKPEPKDHALGRKIAAIPAVLFGYTLLMPLAGYLASTFAAAYVLFRVLGSYRHGKCLLAAAVTTVLLELVFVLWLNTPLPAGRWIQF